MSTLAAVWPQVKYLISDNVSLIPVRDKDGIDYKGDPRPAKTPYEQWTKLQSTRLTEGQLWSDMEKHGTTAIAIVCGAVSGGIEVIDVDVKYKPGIDATLLKDIQTLYPDIYSRLRIHRTPSKGCHLIYRVSGHPVPGNIKLAGRKCSEEEIQAQIDAGKKRLTKEVNFLETRAEKGYILAPPSMGYSIVQDKPIPTLTWEERCSLIGLCHTYTELVKVVAPPKPAQSQEDKYSVNPFEDYNLNGDFIDLLEEHGWSLLSENADRYMFTRPDKDNGVSATWHKDNHCFYVFTSSTEFEPSKGYNPSTVLSMLQFANDKAKTYQYLTDKGYGIFKPFVEESMVKKLALSKKEVPNNLSDTAKENYVKLKERYKEHLPFGRFWNLKEKSFDKFEISREDLYKVSESLGFRLYNKTQVIRIKGQLLENITEKEFFNILKEYIWEENTNTFTAICNAYEGFIQNSGSFTIGRLKDIDKNQILKDGQFHAYKYFKNGILKITATQHELLSYDEFDSFIWAHKIYDREWTDAPPESNLYESFLKNAIGISGYLKRVLGYLTHDHKSEASGYLVTLTEKTIDPKDGGGSGKNIFGNILAGTTTVKTVPGSSIKFDDRFLAPWNYERIYFLADIPKRIDWLFLKEMVTGSGYVNKKYIAEYDVKSEEMPKILLNTNYSYDDVDGGLKRRIRQLEFTNFYTLNGGVDAVHGKMFPGDFDAADWAGYDHFIMESLKELFRAKGKIELIALSQEGWVKKFNLQHNETTLEFFNENIQEWCAQQFLPTLDFKEQYQHFCRENAIPEKYRKESRNLTNCLKDYCAHYGITFTPNVLERIEAGPTKGKKFGPHPEEQY